MLLYPNMARFPILLASRRIINIQVRKCKTVTKPGGMIYLKEDVRSMAFIENILR